MAQRSAEAYLVAQHSAEKRTGGDEPTVFVVDDDEDYRDSLKALLNSVGTQGELVRFGRGVAWKQVA